MANEQIKYLDLAGLLTYDGLIKAYSDGKDATLKTYVDGLVGQGGSVQQQIEAAIEALDGGTISLTNKQPVTSISQVDGEVSASTGNIDAQYVDVTWSQETPESTSTNVLGALIELFAKIGQTSLAGQVKVYNSNNEEVSAIAADGSTYTIKQGTTTVATMNIARDMVVSSGSVVVATGNETDVPTGQTLEVGKKYVRLVIANATDGKNIYIAVNELYDDYTFTDSDEIDFTETNNSVSAEIKTGSIAKSKLTTALQNEITSARTTLTEKSTGHVTLTKTAGTGATPDNYVIAESDIASASDLGSEITRAQSAETAIDGAIGLTKGANDETRSWTPTTNYSATSGTHTVKNNMQAIDTQLKSVSDTVNSLTAITENEINGLFTTQLQGS